jgi:F0F1-type ATP synthase assembly protein I
MAQNEGFPDWVRYSGSGLELAGAVAGFALIGYWIDKHYGSDPWGIIVGLMLGLVGGLYNFVRQSLQATREAKLSDDSRQQDSGSNEGGGEA